jgi:hypothetical protein
MLQLLADAKFIMVLSMCLADLADSVVMSSDSYTEFCIGVLASAGVERENVCKVDPYRRVIGCVAKLDFKFTLNKLKRFRQAWCKNLALEYD